MRHFSVRSRNTARQSGIESEKGILFRVGQIMKRSSVRGGVDPPFLVTPLTRVCQIDFSFRYFLPCESIGCHSVIV